MELPRHRDDDLIAMPKEWTPVAIENKWFSNVAETALTRANAAMENTFVSESGAHMRFPGLKGFATIGPGRVYVSNWRGDLIAATSHGRLYRIDQAGNAIDVTGVPISGGRRCIFAKTDEELVIAAGGPIIRFAGDKTEILSPDAPDSTHVAFVDNYLVAIEPYSGRFYHCAAGQYRSWDPLDVFSADGQPDDLHALLVTPYRELLLCGEDSIEQFERLPSGSTPFFRRWAVGEGVLAPYTLVAADNGAFALNRFREFVRFSGQTSQSTSDDIGRTLEGISDFTDAWADLLQIAGQKFIVLQIPHAVSPYGREGVTLLHDFRQQRWMTLYGWDANSGIPDRWPGWSCQSLWGRHFIGAEGSVLELSLDSFDNDGQVQRMLVRTAHLSEQGESRIDNLRLRLRRGDAETNSTPSTISVRVNRDNRGFGKWVRRSYGAAGHREMHVEFGGFGCAHSWQFEMMTTDACRVEVVSLQVQMTKIGR